MEYSNAIQRLLKIIEDADYLAAYLKRNIGNIDMQRVQDQLKHKKFLHIAASLDSHEISPKDAAIQVLDDFKAINIILKSMGEKISRLNFFKVVVEAIEEANSTDRTRTNIRSQKSLEKISSILLEGSKLECNWWTFNSELEEIGAYTILDSLSQLFSNQNPVLPLLERENLNSIATNFQGILDEVIESDLPVELKRFIIKGIEQLLESIREYQISGSEGIKRATQKFVAEWVAIESRVDREHLKKPIVARVVSGFVVLNSFLGVDLLTGIGLVPDIESYWMKKINNYSSVQEIVSMKSKEESLSLQQIIDEASKQFVESSQKLLADKVEPKALPPGKEQN